MNINNTKWIEVYTKNGYRKLLNIAEITNVSERANGTSVIEMSNSKVVFTIDSYDAVLNKMQSHLNTITLGEEPVDYHIEEV